jgi:DNA-directed RNA polymerase II subunit RPB1
MWTGKQILSRHSIFTRQDPSSPHYLPVNLNRIGQNAKQVFHIDAVKTLSDKLIVVRGGDPLSFGCQSIGEPATQMTLNTSRHSSTQQSIAHLQKCAVPWLPSLRLSEKRQRNDTQHIPAFLDSTVDRSPAEMCGTLAAQPQAIGEAATQ